MPFIKKKEIINEFGFTMIEALITIGIIAIMSVVYLNDYRPVNQKIILDQAVVGLVSDLYQAQNMAMNVKVFNGEIPTGGYGVNFNSTTSYVLFADCNNNHVYNNNNPVCISNTISEKVAVRELPRGVYVVLSDSDDNITFQPPNPIVRIYNSGAEQTASLARIVLQYGSSGPTRTVEVNRFTGQINLSN